MLKQGSLAKLLSYEKGFTCLVLRAGPLFLTLVPLQKHPIDWKIFQWKCSLQNENGLALSKMKLQALSLAKLLKRALIMMDVHVRYDWCSFSHLCVHSANLSFNFNKRFLQYVGQWNLLEKREVKATNIECLFCFFPLTICNFTSKINWILH